MKSLRCLILTTCVSALAGAAWSEGKPVTPPDLNGVYYTATPPKALKTVDGKPIPLTAAGRAALAANAAKVAASKLPPSGDAMDACVPVGPIRILEQPYPLEVVQKGKTILLIWEHNHIWEHVYFDTQPDPDADPSYPGFSVGHWDGATLVVDTSNFNQATFLDDNGLPHSPDLKVERRIRKIEHGKALQIEATVTDPVMYSRPWTVRAVLPLRPDISIEEFVCGQKTLETRYTRAAK
jgi:hypothetical protein